MRTFQVCIASLALLVVGILVGCSQSAHEITRRF